MSGTIPPASKVIDLAEMRRLVEDQRRQEDQSSDQPAEAKDSSGSDRKFIRSCFYENERGDGRLFAKLHRDKYLRVKAWDEKTGWLMWNGIHWERDVKESVFCGVETVALQFNSEALHTRELRDKAIEEARSEDVKKLDKELGEYRRRVEGLRGLRRAKACLEWAHKIGDESLAIVGDEIDQRPWLLPCANGVIDLKTGEVQPGLPDDLLVKAIPVQWQGVDAPRPTWDAFIREIHQDDPELCAFVQRLLGYSLTGLTVEHFIAVFIGEGRNGKGTMLETVKAVLGELAWSIQSDLLMENKSPRSTAGPSPDIISFKGVRLAIASETDKHAKISPARIKLFTGGDTLCGRAPHDRFEINFRPTHTLVLATNHTPSGLTKDFALLKRLLYINYPLKFVDGPDPTDPTQRQRDPDLVERLRGEYPGILAWLVQGCLLWQRDGLAPPSRIHADIEELRLSEDHLQQFLNDCCDQSNPDATIGFTEFYGCFRKWYWEMKDDRPSFTPTKNSIGRELTKKGIKRNNTGDRKVYGITISDPELLYAS